MKIKFLKYASLIAFIFIGCGYSIFLIKSMEYRNDESYQYKNALFERELKKINSEEYVFDKKEVNDLLLLGLESKYEQEIIIILCNLLVVVIVGLCLVLIVLVLKEIRINRLKSQLEKFE